MDENFRYTLIGGLSGIIGTLHNIVDGTTKPEMRMHRIEDAQKMAEKLLDMLRPEKD